MNPHECREGRTCTCNIAGLEPNEDCPIHGLGVWPPRCEECGHFLPWRCKQPEELAAFEEPKP